MFNWSLCILRSSAARDDFAVQAKHGACGPNKDHSSESEISVFILLACDIPAIFRAEEQVVVRRM